MSGSETVPRGEPLAPEDWPTAEERRYAQRQADLAAHYDLDVSSRAVETDVMGRVHYLEAGDPAGEPVVLLHGVGTNAAMFIPMLPALAEDYRLLVPDRPGRGLSAAPSYADLDLRRAMTAYLVEFLDELDLDRPHVVGNSLGGLQAFLLTVDHGRVDRLCLVGAPGGLSGEMPLLFRLTTVRGVNRVLYWLLGRGDPVDNARQQAEQLLVEDTSAIPEAFYELVGAADELPGRQRSLRSLNQQQASFGRLDPVFDITDEVVDIERPTAYIWGTEDYFWPPEVGREVAEQMPNAEFHVLQGHGHMPWMEPGDEVETAVWSFLHG
ncbi:alpha/beta fold hydrolase [Halobacteriales archaeon Cl-PHB]